MLKIRGEGRATKQESPIKGWRSALTLERRINFIQVTRSPRPRERERERAAPRYPLDCKLVDFMRPWSPINIPSLSSGSAPPPSPFSNRFTRDVTFFEDFRVGNWSRNEGKGS